MRRIVLFSEPTEGNLEKILDLIFPKEMKNKVFGYMPSGGANTPQKYIDEWRNYAKQGNSGFELIDNTTQKTVEEAERLLKCNILAISGGNTFKLLDNLRKSGLDKAIIEFSKKDNFVLAGFSAGAMVLSPSIEISGLRGIDENLVGLTDLTGLGIVDFEIFPHYDESKQKELLSQYRLMTTNKVKELTNEDVIWIDR